MRFTKMHGAGNDYVYVDCFREPMPDNPADLARRMADRHFGIGGDGLILICPSEKADAKMRMFNSDGAAIRSEIRAEEPADAKMRMFNADGSEAEMCGNGVRCVAKYVYDHGISKQETLRIETGAGILTLQLEIVDGKAQRVRVDMGEPILVPQDVPTTLPGNPKFDGSPAMDVDLHVDNTLFRVGCVSMGNPHCVMFVDEITDHQVLQLGPRIETDPHFPNRVNALFVKVLSATEIRMRVWERGSGETLACGTGACAVCVAGVLFGHTQRKILAHLPGGDLELHWADDNHVYMTGPAVEVFSGEWDERSATR